MNPEGYPLQGRGFEGYPGYPGQPEVTTAVQFTTVNVVTEPPKDHIIWSLCCFVYSNPFCLGLVALIFSIKSRDRKMVGDLEGARKYGTTARIFNIVSTVLVCILIVSFIIFIIVIVVTAQQSYHYYNSHYKYGHY